MVKQYTEITHSHGCQLITTHIVRPCDLGLSGNLYGGQVMSWMDESAAIYAMWAVGGYRVVTKRFSEITFDSPVRCGDLLCFYCGNPKKGNTSISFDVRAEVRGELKFQAQCTFVRVDERGCKQSIDWAESPLP